MSPQRPRFFTVEAFLITLSVVAAASVVLAAPAYSPGWNYGRANCGPKTSTMQNASQCKTCCRTGIAPFDWAVGEFDNCDRFCDQAAW